jgi:hypothetical protein
MDEPFPGMEKFDQITERQTYFSDLEYDWY